MRLLCSLLTLFLLCTCVTMAQRAATTDVDDSTNAFSSLFGVDTAPPPTVLEALRSLPAFHGKEIRLVEGHFSDLLLQQDHAMFMQDSMAIEADGESVAHVPLINFYRTLDSVYRLMTDPSSHYGCFGLNVTVFTKLVAASYGLDIPALDEVELLNSLSRLRSLIVLRAMFPTHYYLVTTTNPTPTPIGLVGTRFSFSGTEEIVDSPLVGEKMQERLKGIEVDSLW